ncbi:unc-89 [Symbiodinium sp. CCMP2592]|nr:unc-89 [Symbiodinium sp. CCMP2592]
MYQVEDSELCIDAVFYSVILPGTSYEEANAKKDDEQAKEAEANSAVKQEVKTPARAKEDPGVCPVAGDQEARTPNSKTAAARGRSEEPRTPNKSAGKLGSNKKVRSAKRRRVRGKTPDESAETAKSKTPEKLAEAAPPEPSKTPKSKTPSPEKPAEAAVPEPSKTPKSKTPSPEKPAEAASAEPASKTPKSKTPTPQKAAEADPAEPSKTPKSKLRTATPEKQAEAASAERTKTPKSKTPTPQKDAGPEPADRSKTPKRRKSKASTTPKSKTPSPEKPAEAASAEPSKTPKSKTPSPAKAEDGTSQTPRSTSKASRASPKSQCSGKPWDQGWSEWGGQWSYPSWNGTWSGNDWYEWKEEDGEKAPENKAGKSDEKDHEKKASKSDEKAHEKEASKSEKAAGDHGDTASRVDAILRRGHTVDQLTTEELHLIVGHIDKQKKAEGSEDKKEEVENDSEKPEESKPAAGETKEERRKRLHARNMRYYRSLESINCPPEIARLARKAVDEPGQRSYMFESWLASNEDWKKSSLLVTLRRKGSSARKGLRKWMLYTEMITKWGAEIALAMKESKESDEHRRKNEIRDHPDASHLKQYLCLWEASEEDLDEEAFETVFSVGVEDTDSSSSNETTKKKKKKKTKKAKKAKKSKKASSPSPKKRSPKKPKGKGKGKGANKSAKALTAEEQEVQETRSNANKALKKANERIKAATKVKDTNAIDGVGPHLLKAMKDDVEAQANLVGEARAELQAAVDRDEAGLMADATSKLNAAVAKYDTIQKDLDSRAKGTKGGKERSDDEDDGDAANGLLQNILERVSNGAETVGSAMNNARASYEESGRSFKGKVMSKLMTYRPGNDSRDFFKNVNVPLEPTEVPTTIYEGFEGDRKVVHTTVPVLDPHELLDFLYTELKLECPMSKVRGFWQHMIANNFPFALHHPHRAALETMQPFSIYGDELTLGKDPKDKVTGIFLQLTLFKPKAARQGIWLLCALQDACCIHDNLATLTPVLEHIVWSCNQACTGSYPTVSRTGSALTGLKAKKAGQKFSGDTRWVCAELKGDWKWHERTLRLLRTPVSKKCCFLCNAEASDAPLRYYDDGDGAAWRHTLFDTADFLRRAIRPGQVSPLTLLTGFDVSMIKFCSMHVCNLGLVHTASGGALEALLREGHFGPYNDPDDLKALLETAYGEFQVWRRANKIACSQRSFAPRHLKKRVHGYYLTTKAYNARIVMLWLASKLQDVARQAAVSQSIRVHATALTAFSNWFSGNEKAKRFLTPAQSQEIYANGKLFLRCHLQLTRMSHRLQIFSWILKPKFHAMLHLLEQSKSWRYNTRYTHCFAGEDAMGWLKRVSLRAPRKPGAFNRWVMRMGILKIVASKRRLTRMLGHQYDPA